MELLYTSDELRKCVCPYTVPEGSATGYHEWVRQAQVGGKKRHINSKFILCVYTVAIVFLPGIHFSFFWKQHSHLSLMSPVFPTVSQYGLGRVGLPRPASRVESDQTWTNGKFHLIDPENRSRSGQTVQDSPIRFSSGTSTGIIRKEIFL